MDKQTYNNINTNKTYVVVRDGKRVSEREYESSTDPLALEEVKHWNKIITKYPDGTKVKIEVYDNKKHRIY